MAVVAHQDTPPLLCTIGTPSRYSPNLKDAVVKQHVPNDTICDYIILDIEQLPDGGYNCECSRNMKQ
ncbi:hypothetical protein MRX96_003054 [Rhipicephalus microplus]